MTDLSGVGAADAFLLDRRKRDLKTLHRSGLAIAFISECASPLGSRVYVVGLELSGKSLANLPRQIRSQTTIYRRVLDHFYLPRIPEPSVSTALFEICASRYEKLVDQKRNVRNIALLLRTAVHHSRVHGPLRTLDFGCGTGLSTLALRLLPETTSRRIDLIGTDASPTMLSLASRGGLRTIDFGDWLGMPESSFEAIIASFVLHCGLLDRELEAIGKQLVPQGIFVANYFGAGRSTLGAFQKKAARVRLMKIGSIERDPKNPILVFRAKG